MAKSKSIITDENVTQNEAAQNASNNDDLDVKAFATDLERVKSKVRKTLHSGLLRSPTLGYNFLIGLDCTF